MKKIFTIGLLSFSCIFSLSSCNKKETVSKESYDQMYDHLVDCWNQSLSGIHFDNVFYGDSRIAGGDFTGAFKGKSVVNLGVGGDKVANLIRRFKLIDTVTPKRIFLAIGGNDALSSSYNSETFRAEYSSLLSLFKAKNYDVYIHNVVGLTIENSKYSKSDIDKNNAKISEVNSIISNLAQEVSYPLIDICSKMNKLGTNEMNPDYSADGVHFNQIGYQVWYNELSPILI